MKSVVPTLCKPIDCRHIVVKGLFYSFEGETLKKLLQDLYEEVNKAFSNEYILIWKEGKKVFHGSDVTLEKLVYDGGYILVDGFIKSSIVYNKTSFRKYRHSLEFCESGSIPGIPEIAEDYLDYYDKHLSDYRYDGKKFKDALIELYNLEGKYNYKPLLVRTFFDLEGLIKIEKMENERYCGEFCFSVPYYCFEDDLSIIEQLFLQMADRLFVKYDNLNIQFGVNSSSDFSDYSGHFGTKPNCTEPGVTRTALKYYIPYYYLSGVGTVNYISRKTCRLINENTNKNNVNIDICKTETGGYIISSLTVC